MSYHVKLLQEDRLVTLQCQENYYSLHQSSSAHQISAINVTKIMNCYDFALTDNKLIKIKQLIENKSLN